MTLTGISPTDPTPSDRRELILAGSPGGLGGTERNVLLIGNKTSAGSETINVLDATSPILDDVNARARFGERSELYAEYRSYVAVDPGATIYALCPTEGGGVAAACDLVVATASDATATLEITIHGQVCHVSVANGDAVATTVTAIKDAINNADDGRLQVVATEAAGTTVTVTAAQKGPRGDAIIGADATHGVRTKWLQTNSQTVTKGNVVSGTTADDGTAALVSAANYEAYYWVLPWTAVTTITATDNQIGEAVDTIKTQALPINGKEQVAFCGLRGTQAQATAVAISAGANSVHLHCAHQENSEWTPAMLAAHLAAVKRSQEVKHPSANVAGYTNTDNTIWHVPPPYLVADRPTATEIRADLNNGVSPIAVRPNGGTYLVRDVTSRSQNSSGDKDYRAREGHIYSAVSFAWQEFKSRYAAQKQPFVDDDPAEGQMPVARTTTPSSARSIMISVIDDLTGSKPLGRYDGPILAPSKRQKMIDGVVATKIPAGISISAELFAVEHNLKSETTIVEVGDAY